MKRSRNPDDICDDDDGPGNEPRTPKRTFVFVQYICVCVCVYVCVCVCVCVWREFVNDIHDRPGIFFWDD